MMNRFYKAITYQDNTMLGAVIGVIFEAGIIALFFILK